MSSTETEAAATSLPALVRNISVTDADATPLKREAVVLASKAETLHLTLELDSASSASQYRVTLVVHKRGAASDSNSGEFRFAPVATAFTKNISVQTLGGLSALVLDVADIKSQGAGGNRFPFFHDGSGPYDTTVALTPIGSGGAPAEEQTTSVSYGFFMFDPNEA